MKKVTIEVEIPVGLDIQHTMLSVSDAILWSDNVTQQEHDLVSDIIDRIHEQIKQETLNNQTK